MQGDLATTGGLPVAVIGVGTLNKDAGPDFLDARIRIGDTLWAGNVEIHTKSSCWRQHQHEEDPKYNNVVLHVVWEKDGEASTQNGCTLPTLELRPFVSDEVFRKYERLTDPDSDDPIRCSRYLQEVEDWRVAGSMDRLAVERLERKSQEVRRLLADARGSWETCCYWLLARYFGGKANAFAFELLAKSCDQKLLARWKDNPMRVEALLMGQAGLLEGDFDDDYPQQLQADYEAIRYGCRLTPISGFLWKTFRLRPSSFPTLRISQFAMLVCRSSNLFQYMLEQRDVKKLQELFHVQASDYWYNHYQFDKESAPRPKHVGKDFVDMLIMNAWVPLLLEYGSQHAQEEYRDIALELLQQMAPENNHIERLWIQKGIRPQNAAQSQALLELYNEYCTAGRCPECQIGYQIIKKKERAR